MLSSAITKLERTGLNDRRFFGQSETTVVCQVSLQRKARALKGDAVTDADLMSTGRTAAATRQQYLIKAASQVTLPVFAGRRADRQVGDKELHLASSKSTAPSTATEVPSRTWTGACTSRERRATGRLRKETLVARSLWQWRSVSTGRW